MSVSSNVLIRLKDALNVMLSSLIRRVVARGASIHPWFSVIYDNGLINLIYSVKKSNSFISMVTG